VKKPWHPLPAEVYALVERTPATVLLDCSDSAAPEPLSRLFTSPLRVLVANDPQELADLFAQIQSATDDGHVAAGFFGYECGAAFEPKASVRRQVYTVPDDPFSSRKGKIAQPLAWFGIYRGCHLFDHAEGAFVDGTPPELAQTQLGASNRGESAHETSEPGPLDITWGLTRQQYAHRIKAIHEWIRAGDVYQLNFTFPLRARVPANSAALYTRLRAGQPVRYGAFIHWQPDRHILSFSPELFFRLDGFGATRRITTRPMKGTSPRGRTTAEDRQIADWLRTDPKNRSENVMIVDLLRNDLGRLCTYGSVRVEDLFSIERFPSLWQMTSTVSGSLRPEVGYEEVFRALFPCGSVTGAPKVHAMQLLAQIEQRSRGIYTGAIGFFSRARTVFNVAIRTLEMESSSEVDVYNVKMGVGSGIVIDSNADDEFRECQLKAEFLTRCVEPFSLIETLLWHGEYPLIELHLDRLEDSAHYFGFNCDRAAIKAALLAAASAFPGDSPSRVKLLVQPDGGVHIAHEPLSSASAATQPGRVSIASHRTDPGDRMLFHKTTHRQLYDECFKTATQSGFCDVLFLNQRGEVTEGAVSNIFVEKEGRWFTPPIECGLLPGVYRRHLLETQPRIEPRILTMQDLKDADVIYLTNAVRGLRRVEVEWEK
jgi:para-aminobenzoate synthetase/4-amino-4-deoxychorismate lyase